MRGDPIGAWLRSLMPQYWIRNHTTGNTASYVADLILSADESQLVYKDREYRSAVSNGEWGVVFWDHNWPYAWFSEGEYITNRGQRFYWKNEMPHRMQQVQLKDLFERIKLDMLTDANGKTRRVR